jgi:hypothetical protein
MNKPSLHVTPAKAGAPLFFRAAPKASGVPAFAGTTGMGLGRGIH